MIYITFIYQGFQNHNKVIKDMSSQKWFIEIMDFSKFNHNIDLFSLLIFIWGKKTNYIVILKLYIHKSNPHTYALVDS